jgi:hypothetical protein
MCGRRGMRRGVGGVAWRASPHQEGVTSRLAGREVQGVGQPYAGTPPVRCEGAGGGTPDGGPRRPSLPLPAAAVHSATPLSSMPLDPVRRSHSPPKNLRVQR